VEGVHTRVVEKLCEANTRSALEFFFEFRKSMPGGNTRKCLKLGRKRIFQGVDIIFIEHSKSENKECTYT
jgi:hypothetical protein